MSGELEQLEPLVARLLAPNPSPFTGTGTQVHLIGIDNLAVIDPGPDDSAHLEALTAAIAGRTVRAILVTHHHRDHSPATRPLSRATGAPVIGAAPFARGGSTAFDPDYAPDHVLADGEEVNGTDWTLQAIATPGHSSNHLCFALPQARALFTGDHVMGWSTTVVAPPDGDMGAYLDSLERLQSRDDRIFYPAHGDPVEQPQRLLRGMIGHRRQREAQILRLLGDGVESVSALTERMYVGLDERLRSAAAQSITAHMFDLERRNLIVASGEGLWRSS